MNEKIILNFRYTAEDYARGTKYMQGRVFIVKYAYFVPFAFFFFTILILFIRNPQKTFNTFSNPRGFMPIVIAAILCIPIFYYLRRKKYNYLVKKRFEGQIESSPALQTEKTIVFDEDGMMGYSKLANGEVDWEAFIEVTETEDDFYFFTAKRIGQLIPKRVFENEAQQNKLKDLVKRKLGEKAKLQLILPE